MSVQCFECYVARELAGLAACSRHASAEERAAAYRRVSEIAYLPHPMLAPLRPR